MGLLAALQFLTRLPIRLPRAVPTREFVVWFPAAGALIGLLCGSIGWLAAQAFPLPVAGALAVVAGLLITGAFHEDGLGDVADAFGGGWDVAQRLEILKDSRHGTYGVVAIVSSIGLRLLLVGYAPDAEALLVGFVAAGALGRVAAVLVLLLGRPATRSGLAASLVQTLHRGMCALGTLVGVAFAGAALSLGWPAAETSVSVPALLGILILVAALAALALWRLAIVKIGGIVGDVLGAAEQVTEVAVWALLIALLA